MIWLNNDSLGIKLQSLTSLTYRYIVLKKPFTILNFLTLYIFTNRNVYQMINLK